MDTRTLKVNNKYRELYFDTRGGGKHIVTGEFCEADVAPELVKRWNAYPELVTALEEALRTLVTPQGFPDAKHRTQEQQRAYDRARAAIANAINTH